MSLSHKTYLTYLTRSNHQNQSCWILVEFRESLYHVNRNVQIVEASAAGHKVLLQLRLWHTGLGEGMFKILWSGGGWLVLESACVIVISCLDVTCDCHSQWFAVMIMMMCCLWAQGRTYRAARSPGHPLPTRTRPSHPYFHSFILSFTQSVIHWLIHSLRNECHTCGLWSIRERKVGRDSSGDCWVQRTARK